MQSDAKQSNPQLTRTLSGQNCHRGENILDLTYQLPLLFIFLRQLGCIFCRQTLKELSERRTEIEMEGTAIALVHMSSPENADQILSDYGLENVVRISDPQKELYNTFQLQRAGLVKVLGPHVWYKAAVARFKHKSAWGKMAGDPYQMPGAFLVYQGKIINQFTHQQPYDLPDYLELATIPMEIENSLAANRLPMD